MNKSDVLKTVQKRRSYFQSTLIKWAKLNFREFPWRNNNRTQYSVLIAECLLRRTTATAALKIYETFLGRYTTIADLAKADVNELERVLAKIGLQKQRAKYMLSMAKYLCSKHAGTIPATERELLKLPMVGQYIARAVLSFGFGIAAAIVDSNVERIIRRVFGLDPTKVTPKLLSEIAELLLNMEEHVTYNYGLLDFGALICRYARPKCCSCPLSKICDWYKYSVNGF
jgi:A/G-specific adenine glycosylase